MERRKYHIVIAAIIFAILTWVSVNMRDDYTVVMRLPVVLENLKEGKALKYPVPKHVSVRFRGTGWSLAALYLSPDVRYYIDLSSLGSEGFTITSHDVLEHVKLPVALQPLDIKPDSLMLALDDYTEKRVPVMLHIVVNYRDGYGAVGAPRINPDSVVVRGSQHLVGQVKGWPTEYRRFDNLNALLDVNVPLEQPPTYSVDLSVLAVHYHINVQPFAEKTFPGIPLEAAGTPTNREVIFIPPKIDIIARGGIDQLARLSPDDFHAIVHYQYLVEDSVTMVTPTLNAPEGVKIVSQKPAQFQFIIRKKL
jgi:hypothetical protein